MLVVMLSCQSLRAEDVADIAASKSTFAFPEIIATEKAAPPEWAVMERQLIDSMEEAATVFLDRFTRRDGTLYNYGEWDDVFEMFFNWPLFYTIGADEWILDRAILQYNAAIRQGTRQGSQKSVIATFHLAEPSLVNEFPATKDWFHISEGLAAFYDFGLASPTLPENIDRARRFAGYYMNEDPAAPNWDQEHRLIRGAATGSTGPAKTHYDASYNLSYGHASLYPVVKDQERIWKEETGRRDELVRVYNEIVNPCDVPVNLASTALMTNAFLYTGEEKYRRWVLDYVDAWMERIEKNGGILPDNIGPSGVIGEFRDGQWWGGLYGWTSRYSNHMIFGALTVAAECAHLLSGDPKYLNLLRSQIDILLVNSKTTDQGLLLVPYRYDQNGWSDFRLMNISNPAHLWHASMDAADWSRIERIRAGSTHTPDSNLRKGEPFDWNEEPAIGDRSDGRSEYARLRYYAGENADWPYRVLAADYREMVRRVTFMREDTRDVRTLFSDDLYVNNPVLTKGLTQVALGAPQAIYNGGLLQARVRYYDADRFRPGLPEDVAALVEVLAADRTVIYLVNLNGHDTHRMIIQAGAFSEHTFTEAKYEKTDKAGGKQMMTMPVNSSYLSVLLPPGAAIRLDLGTNRFVNTPSYRFPWHKGPLWEQNGAIGNN